MILLLRKFTVQLLFWKNMTIFAVNPFVLALSFSTQKTCCMTIYPTGFLTALTFVVSLCKSESSRSSCSSPLAVMQESPFPSISSEEVRSRNLHQLERLRERDRQSKEIKQEVRMMVVFYLQIDAPPYCVQYVFALPTVFSHYLHPFPSFGPIRT
jgi:hypothetical protein